MINHLLLHAVRDRTHALLSEIIFRELVRFCVSERFTVGELSHLPKSSSKPLCKACPGCGGMVHIRKVSCSCGHVFVANQHLYTLRSFRAIETVDKAVDQLTKEFVKPRN